MFRFFKPSPKPPELSNEQIVYLENQFQWLLETFGDTPVQKKILVPEKSDLPFVFDGSDQSVNKLLHFVAGRWILNRQQWPLRNSHGTKNGSMPATMIFSFRAQKIRVTLPGFIGEKTSRTVL
jgi:hypothetical protein